ncbi:hypothetical protein SAMN05444377_11323 [Flavobacterium fontis]|uniref:WD40-like Beta Propeller Repeat n=1 Tax=Flavobacterium fontis TaxID=1124188 RepID=A0A1M5CW39_9FLAO|nr:hypothetical protein [Flavobacterium fontis]SHF58964.1 hypothetical protein SAMN05444377_11323 [Flavobacterium fontis]
MLFRFIFLFFGATTMLAQQVQYAHQLLKYSSDLGGKQFGIKRLLGKPDVYPQGGFSPNAWMPKNALDGREVIIVSFEKAQTVQQVAIFENLNAGCVVALAVSSDGEDFQTVWSRRPDYQTPVYKKSLAADRAYYFGRKRRKVEQAPEIVNPGVERIFLEQPHAAIKAVKVVFNFALLPGAKQVDAIAISDSTIPIDPQPETIPELTKISAPITVDASSSWSVPCVIGNTLFVTTYAEDREQIFTFLWDKDRWKKHENPKELNLNPAYNFVEFANNELLLKGGKPFYTGTQETGFELWQKTHTGYQLSSAIKIPAYSNFEPYADATLSSDGKVFIMAVETDFTQGGTDLYVSFQKQDGTFGLLQNMGKAINSAADESSPQLLSDQKTLLFSSNGFSGFGSHDLYLSYRLDDTWKNWSVPKNLGPIINTASYEVHPFYDEEHEQLLYSVSTENQMLLKSVSIPKALWNWQH